MDFLTLQNRVNSGEIDASDNPINAEGKNVLVIGGGDTGSDCVGTSIQTKSSKSMADRDSSKTTCRKNRMIIHGHILAKFLKLHLHMKKDAKDSWNVSTR